MKAKAVLVFLVLLFRNQVTSVGIESICSNQVCFDIECVMFGDRSLPKHNDRNSMSNTGTKKYFIVDTYVICSSRSVPSVEVKVVVSLQ